MSNAPFLDQTQIIQKVYLPDEEALKITPSGVLVNEAFDYVEVAYPDAVTEIYTYKIGGVGGVVQATVTIVYTNASKAEVQTVTKTPFNNFNPGSTGDVVGPASSTDNQLALFDGISGKLLKNTSVVIDDGTGLLPTADSTYNLGSSAAYWAALYAANANIIGKFIISDPSGNPNGKQLETVTLVGGTVTQANTSITANSCLNIMNGGLSGATVPPSYAYTITAGVGYTITSSDVADTSTLKVFIIENG